MQNKMNGVWMGDEYLPAEDEVLMHMQTWCLPLQARNDAEQYIKNLATDRYYAKAVYFPAWWNWIVSQAFESHLETFGNETPASRAGDGTHSGMSSINGP